MLFFTLCRRFISKYSLKVPQQLLKAMKLMTLFLVAVYMNVWATGFGQKVTISGKDLPLEKVFSMIKKQTGYAFFYDYNIFQDTKPVTLNLKDADIEDAMRVCLWGQNLDFSITNKTISVVKKEGKVSVIDPERTVKAQGIVLNESGLPLSGATVTVKETKKSTLTNTKGEFELNGIAVNSILIVSYIGYNVSQVAVQDEQSVKVHMSVAINELDQTIVQAYGTTTRRLATGNIVKVTSAEIERQPVINPLLALQGKVAGLDVSQMNGFASAPIKIELRGRSAVNTFFTSDPLYIIDGVPLTVLEVGGLSTYKGGSTGFVQTNFTGPANGQSPFFNINPGDIESIEVLKDADATAIYGSRGANGVILITTKKGKAGKTKLDFHFQEGGTKQTRFWHMLTTPEYLRMRREALQNDGITPSLDNGDYDLLKWDTTRYTDWQKELYGGTGKAIDVQAGLGGGDERTTYRIGMAYNHTTNILTVSGADQRASFSLNLQHHSRDHRFSMSFNSLYTFTKSDMISLPSSAVILPPNAPPIYDSVGNLNYAGWGDPNSLARYSYPFQNLRQPYTAKTNFLNSNLILNYQLFKGLRLTSSFGYNTSQANQQQFVPIASQDPATDPMGSSLFGYTNVKNWIIEPQINYDVVLGKGKLSSLLGASVQHTNTDGLTLSGDRYTNDALIHSISAAPTVTNTDRYGEYKYAATFARLIYNWENKYILSLNGRRDGSSRFGPGKQYGNFGSIGLAWNFTEEDWLKDKLSFLSFGKIRASYGTTGSDAVGDYQYITRWTSNGTTPYSGIPSLMPSQHANPNFRWQVNKKLEGSIDLGFLNDRINTSVTYYRNRCGNQLVSFPIAAMTGFSYVTANSPALVENSGWEFTLLSKLINTTDFGWSISFNIAINNNKLLAYPNIEQSPYAATLIVGQPLNVKRLMHHTGVDPLTGEYTFKDKNHDGQITFNYAGTTGDDTYPVNISPKFFGGIGMNFNYKSLQLNLFFNFKKQIGQNALLTNGILPGAISNQPSAIIGKEWQKPGDIASVARFTTLTLNSLFNYNSSDALYTDASYIRLSNLSLSYELPSSYIKVLRMQSCRLFFHTNNLFIITKYKGLDPETQYFGAMPPAKTYVGGISFNF